MNHVTSPPKDSSSFTPPIPPAHLSPHQILTVPALQKSLQCDEKDMRKLNQATTDVDRLINTFTADTYTSK